MSQRLAQLKYKYGEKTDNATLRKNTFLTTPSTLIIFLQSLSTLHIYNHIIYFLVKLIIWKLCFCSKDNS